jgi:hypothetical protein
MRISNVKDSSSSQLPRFTVSAGLDIMTSDGSADPRFHRG